MKLVFLHYSNGTSIIRIVNLALGQLWDFPHRGKRGKFFKNTFSISGAVWS